MIFLGNTRNKHRYMVYWILFQTDFCISLDSSDLAASERLW